jgi:hypothetical protein
MHLAKDRRRQEVDLLGLIELIHRHLTDTLCRDVHAAVRIGERQRQWTLEHLARFWTAVTLRAPRSLSQALAFSQTGKDGVYPKVTATTEAFFEKCRDLRWQFFHRLYQGFTASILPEAPPVYGQALGRIWERFPHIMVVDGSKCDAIRHRLKLLWSEKGAVLPGCISALYDVGKGICRHLLFSPDAAEHELQRTEALLAHIPQGTLVMGDRLYALMAFILPLQAAGLHGLFRRNNLVKLRKVQLLSRKQGGRVLLEDWLVEAGSGQTGPKVTLRWIRYREPGRSRDLVTTVLDTQQLTAEEALELYPWRWSVERLFYDLKEVLNLHCFYAANPNAIAMQVYAAAIVHTACRVAQARLAQDQGISPEEISPAKLYPLLATASCYITHLELYHQELEAMHGILAKPSLSKFQFSTTTLGAILVEKRNSHRRKKRFHPQRKRWKSLKHIHGFNKLT